MARNCAVAVLAVVVTLAFGGTATAQLRVGPEVDLSDPGPGGDGPVLSYDSTRGGWLAFWFSSPFFDPDPRLHARYISPDLRPKHDSDTQFDVGRPVTAGYDPVADEHLLTSGGTDYQSTGMVWRFSPMGAPTGGPWRLEDGAMLPSLAVDTRTGAGTVVYMTQPELDSEPTVWAQRLAAGGGPQGAPIRLSQAGTKVALHRAAVAFNPVRGEFAIAWRERRSGIGAFVGDIIMSRLPAASGGPIGIPAAISDSRSTIVSQDPPGIPDGAGAPGLAFDAATGGYLVTWLGARGDVLESATQVYGQRLDGDLREIGPDDFRISSGPGLVDPDTFPAVVANDGMLVAWIRWLGDDPQIVGRRLTDSSLAEPSLLWTAGPDGLRGGIELAGPATGRQLVATAVDNPTSTLERPQLRAVDTGADPGTARIVSGPPDTSTSRTATFGLEPGRPDGTLECRLDGDAWRVCDRSHVVADLPDEVHRLQVRAVGPEGWVQVDPIAADWRVEAAPPDTRITTAPPVNQPHGSFGFEADERSDFECRLDDGAWDLCGFRTRRSSEGVNNLADGPHRFEVRAIDDAGRVDASPALWVWTVDADPPETWIDDGPTGVTPPPGTFVLRSDEPSARFECTGSDVGSGETWTPCQSGVIPTSRGVLRARAIDPSGNADLSPARWEWRPETSPALRLAFDTSTLPADRVFTSRDATVRFFISNAEGPGSVEECRLDGGAWQRCQSPHRIEGLADGTHVLQARTTTRAGIVSPVAELQFSVDTHRPDTFILAKPLGRTLHRTARIEFGATRPATFTCALDGAAAQPCTSPFVLDNVTPGRHFVFVKATGTGGWTEPTGEFVDWTVETDPNAPAGASRSARAARAARAAAAPPATAFFNTPPKSTRSDSATFEWEPAEYDEIIGAECRLDGGDWFACDTPWTLTGLSDGTHRFEARNINADGERDPTPAWYEWTVDHTTAFVVLERRPGSRTNVQVATVEFTADREGATFECRPADGEFQRCTSPYTATGQPEGAYRLIIRAVNGGKIGPTRTVDWVIDRTPPDTVISGDGVSPGTTTSRTELAFTWRATGHAAVQGTDGIYSYVEPEFYTVQCRLDGGPWNYCANLEPVKNLADGPHVIEAVATDEAGNADPTAARLEWTVDTSASDTFIDAGPAATEQQRGATFSLRAQPAADGFECRLDGGPWRACAATHTLTGVPDGSHTFETRSVRRGSPDRSPARWLWTVDADPTPTVLSGPPERTADRTARFGLAADDPGARIDCSLDGGVWQTCGTEPTFPALADGDHSLAVRAVDGAGRTGVLAQPWRWTVDTRVPDTELVSGPEVLRRWRDADFAFRSDEDGTRFQCRVDGGAWATCRSPLRTGGHADGTHTFDVRAIDATGNTDASPASASWRVDATQPYGQLTTSSSEGSTTFTVAANEPVTVAECRIDEGPWTPCGDGATFGTFAEGPHRLDAHLVDEAGNAWYWDGLRTWTVRRPVETEIVRRPSASETSTFAEFRFSGDGASLACSLDGGAWVTCSSPLFYNSLANGHHVFEVAAVDFGGVRDATPDRWEWDVYSVPNTTFNLTPPASTTDRTAHFNFGPGSAYTYQCRLDGGAWASCPRDHTISGLSVGPHRLEVYATDSRGVADPTPAVWDWTVTAAAAAATTRTTQVARGAAEAVGDALAGSRWRSVLTGRRRVAVPGAPRELVVRVRSRGRIVAAAKVRIRATGTRRLALRRVHKVRHGARVTVAVTWRPASGSRQTARLTARLRR